MEGKTHMVVGLGTSLALLPTNSVAVVAGGTFLALMGSLMPDIDLKGTKGERLAPKAIVVAIGAIVLGIIRNDVFGIHEFRGKSIVMTIMALLALCALIIYGMKTEHRTFTHSIIGVIAYSIPIFMIVDSMVTWFTVGYTMHIMADLLNKQKIKLLPFGKGICFYMCTAGGIVNKIMFIGFSLLVMVEYAIILLGLF